ncbi:MAG TPA: ATP-grasp domain-containing protein [Vicinamibacterales bacterium]|nr:ATP-grasp domain-containing protein [Vicinamibacterales bacterium]
MRVLVLATTTGYQTRSFGEAAERVGVELVFATDRCHAIDDPWRDGAIPIRFHEEEQSADAIVSAVRSRPIDGLLVVGDRPTVIAARVAEALGLPGHPPAAAAAARHKRLTRERFRAAGLPTPWFVSTTLNAQVATLNAHVSSLNSDFSFPCVVKPVALSGSRGVMRADGPDGLARALDRLRALMAAPDIRAERHDAHREILVEGFIPGHEYAVDAVLHHGRLHLVAIFDKPDPLDGPFFEETIYVTPPNLSPVEQDAIVGAVADAAAALGLHHGPIHAELRVNPAGVFVLEVAARPIGGLCARAVHLESAIAHPHAASAITLEEMLLRHALGDAPDQWRRAEPASGVMMIPIPKRGHLRGVDGLAAARAVPGVDDIRITAKPDQLLLPLPEGASYLGFIFARGTSADAVVHALRIAHDALEFHIDPELKVVQSRHG